MGHIVRDVPPGTLGQELGLLPGDQIERINEQALIDLIDYQYLMAENSLSIEYIRDGERQVVECEKEEFEELGVDFAHSLLQTRSCKNKCIFCFIDQMPKGMRESLYVKDDDWRMSLMMGNFVTLTNVDDQELGRIIARHASPLYISVHATDGAVRKQMMGNPAAANIMVQLRKLAKASIQFHCQVVLCPNVNDGKVLEKTLTDLAALSPAAQSVALVPVGLTSHRQGLYPLAPYTQDQAQEVLRIAAVWQKKCYKQFGTRFVFPSDEFYCIAEQKLPSDECYEDYAQIENGVGLFAQMREEFSQTMQEITPSPQMRKVVIACGVSIAEKLWDMVSAHSYGGTALGLVAVESTFFGGAVTVTGLVVGADLVQQLRGIQADAILLSDCMLRAQGDLFLDDMTILQVENEIGVPIIIVENTGVGLARALCGITETDEEV